MGQQAEAKTEVRAGIVERVTFHNPENGFCVLRLKPQAIAIWSQRWAMPPGFCMGMLFPLGLARVADLDPAFVPWARGLNGCTSVVSAAAATLLAMHLGFTATVAIAVALYGLAALAFRAPISPARARRP